MTASAALAEPFARTISRASSRPAAISLWRRAHPGIADSSREAESRFPRCAGVEGGGRGLHTHHYTHAYGQVNTKSTLATTAGVFAYSQRMTATDIGEWFGAFGGSWLWYRLARWLARGVSIGERAEAALLRFAGLLVLVGGASAALGTPPERVVPAMLRTGLFGLFWLWRYSAELRRERERLELVERAETAEAEVREARRARKRRRTGELGGGGFSARRRSRGVPSSSTPTRLPAPTRGRSAGHCPPVQVSTRATGTTGRRARTRAPTRRPRCGRPQPSRARSGRARGRTASPTGAWCPPVSRRFGAPPALPRRCRAGGEGRRRPRRAEPRRAGRQSGWGAGELTAASMVVHTHVYGYNTAQEAPNDKTSTTPIVAWERSTEKRTRP